METLTIDKCPVCNSTNQEDRFDDFEGKGCLGDRVRRSRGLRVCEGTSRCSRWALRARCIWGGRGGRGDRGSSINSVTFFAKVFPN